MQDFWERSCTTINHSWGALLAFQRSTQCSPERKVGPGQLCCLPSISFVGRQIILRARQIRSDLGPGIARKIAPGTVMKILRASASPGTLARLLRRQAWLLACLMSYPRPAHAALKLVQLLQRPACMALSCFLLVLAKPAAGRALLPTSQPAIHAHSVRVMTIQLWHPVFDPARAVSPASHLPISTQARVVDR